MAKSGETASGYGSQQLLPQHRSQTGESYEPVRPVRFAANPVNGNLSKSDESTQIKTLYSRLLVPSSYMFALDNFHICTARIIIPFVSCQSKPYHIQLNKQFMTKHLWGLLILNKLTQGMQGRVCAVDNHLSLNGIYEYIWPTF